MRSMLRKLVSLNTKYTFQLKEKVDNIVLEIDGYVFVVKGERCTACYEEVLYENETRRVIESAKGIGVWLEPLKLYRHLSKSGRGLVLRIPTDLEKQLNLTEKDEIAITKIGNKIVIEAKR